ncbi:MAG TPA: hypothetical protein VK043_03960, partial [Burkholderiales bacterium]|nr:hypothetical protein [Burkholderiales bacterium]
MRKKALGLSLAALALGMLASEPVLAGGRHHHHHRHGRLSIGLHFGAPLYWSPWGGYTYFYSPPPAVYYAPVVVPSRPPVYIERDDAAPASDTGGWWYYCEATRGYYPYVKECPQGWRKVP